MGEIQYPDHFITRLQTLWGEGFLSPGGPEEVKEITQGIELAGKTVLDVGCGTGGPAIVMVRDMGAARVVAIDVEAQLLEHAAHYAQKANAANKIEFKLVEPGSLPFPNDTFDVVFSKDSLIHVADKEAMYREIVRVLRPGSAFVASDWLGGKDTATAPEWLRVRELSHLDFVMTTALEAEEMLSAAGFSSVSTRDRNAWYAELCRYELEQVTGPLRDELIEAVGEEIYSHWVKVRRAFAEAAAVGALRPTHLRGYKPTVEL